VDLLAGGAMSNSLTDYRAEDFCTIDQGLDYIFARMGAIYGAVFTRHWESVDPALVRQVWAEECGRMLTYRPKLDYALRCMNQDRPPSALAFKNLLNSGPAIPDKPNFHIGRQLTQAELAEEKRRADIARAKIKELVANMRMTK
jgi:hypothetical protein